MKRWVNGLMLACLLVMPQVHAESRSMKSLDYEACRALVQAGKILSMQELMELVKSLSDGKIIDTRLLQQDDLYIYEMEIAGTDGMVKMLYVDARSGALADPLAANTQ